MAAAVESDFVALGWQASLAQAGIPLADVSTLLGFALKNYNANHDRLLDQHLDPLRHAITLAINSSPLAAA